MSNTVDPIDIHVGHRVRGRRITLGISQTELGDSIGVTFQQVQKYEQGKNRLAGSRMAKAAKALKVSPAYFFDGGPGVGRTDGDDTAEWLARPDANKALQAFVRIKSRGVRQAVVGLLRALVLSNGGASAAVAPGLETRG